MTTQTAQDLSWQEATLPAAVARAHLGFDLDVDVCIVGAGLAGLTAAREMARAGWSVAVLEARQVASGASRGNLGFVMPGFSEDIDAIVDRVGPDHARALWALSEEGVHYVRDAIAGFAAQEGHDAITLGQGWLRVARRGTGEDMAARTARHAALGARVEHWPAERLRAVLRSPQYDDAMHVPDAFHIQPLRYARALAAAAEEAGVQIFENTAALSFDPTGVRKRILTSAARVRAAHVVVAGNVRLGGLMPRLASTLMPVTTYAAVTQPLGAALAEAIRFAGAVSDSRGPDGRYRIVDGDRLMWSGGLTTWSGDPRRYRQRLRADIVRTYPQLRDVAFAYLWSGTMGAPVHKMPQIGELYPGVWVASGFYDHGLNTSALAGTLIAQAVTSGDDRWRLLQPYNLAWAGGRLGRAVVQGVYWAKRLKDRADALLAEPARLEPTASTSQKSVNAELRNSFSPSVADVPRPSQVRKKRAGTAEGGVAKKAKPRKSTRKKADSREAPVRTTPASGADGD